MKQITMYETKDGKKFDNLESAKKYESLCSQMSLLTVMLPQVPDRIDFTNGYGYLQWLDEDVETVKLTVAKNAAKYLGSDLINKLIENGELSPSGIIGRILSDANIPVLYNMWLRIMCIDDKFREWGQPYFATHVGGELTRLN